MPFFGLNAVGLSFKYEMSEGALTVSIFVKLYFMRRDA